MYRAAEYPLLRAVIEYNKRLPKLPSAEGVVVVGEKVPFNNGVAVPGAFKPEQANSSGNAAGKCRFEAITGRLNATDAETAQWITWNVIVPRTAEYTVNVPSSVGAQFRVFLNESQLVAEGASGAAFTGKVKMTPGMRTIKVRASSGTCEISGLEVKN
jgi:hypothetical protein